MARRAADAVPGAHRLKIVSGAPLPAGWTGKLWAVKQGTEAAAVLPAPPDYLLLTDADIVHDPDSLTLARRPCRHPWPGSDLADGETALC